MEKICNYITNMLGVIQSAAYHTNGHFDGENDDRLE